MPGHAGAFATEEARAEHVVGAPARNRVEHTLELGRVVLAVAVEVDGGRVAALARLLEAAAQRGAEAARDRMREHLGASGDRDGRRGVG